MRSSALAPPSRRYEAREVTLLDLLDRLLQGGVAVQGDVTLAAADIDLVNVGLRLVVGAVDTLGRDLRGPIDAPEAPSGVGRPAGGGERSVPPRAGDDVRAHGAADARAHLGAGPEGPRSAPRGGLVRRFPPAAPPGPGRADGRLMGGRGEELLSEQLLDRVRAGLGPRVNADEEKLERGLAQLVMTVIELLRQLMERQAVHRMAAGNLTDEEVERLGRTFMALAERMEELKEAFGLSDEDLNLNLGPLGNLM